MARESMEEGVGDREVGGGPLAEDLDGARTEAWVWEQERREIEEHDDAEAEASRRAAMEDGTKKTGTGDTCSECGAQTYNDERGKAVCKDCPLGKWSDEEGLTTDSCNDCTLGLYGDRGGNEFGLGACSACPAGKYSEVTGGTTSDNTCFNDCLHMYI